MSFCSFKSCFEPRCSTGITGTQELFRKTHFLQVRKSVCKGYKIVQMSIKL